MTTDFGRDMWAQDSVRTGRFASGARLVGQAVYRRLITQRGALRGGEDEANYGFDLTGLVGSVGGKIPAAAAASSIRNECRKDPRVEDAVVTVVRVVDGVAESWLVTVDARTAKGPFELVLKVEDVTVTMVGLST